MSNSNLNQANEKIKEAVVGGYKTIEEGVVGGYKKIEEGMVGGYKKIEESVVDGFGKVTDHFVKKFFAHEGESVEEAKKRLAAQAAAHQGNPEIREASEESPEHKA